MTLDPRRLVEEPVRAALTGVMARGFGLVGIVGLLALWPALAHPEPQLADAIAYVAVAVLLAYAAVVRVARRLSGGVTDEERELAWDRAREIDGDDAALSLLVAGWVPAGLFLALGLLLWPHFTDPNPALAAAWVVIGLPPVAMAWMVATTTWLEACREDLARAEHESERRFRQYWAKPGQ